MSQSKLNRRQFLAGGCGMLVSRAAARSNAALPPRPNIILIMADDLGYGDLGCYGQEKIRTPNIDLLAAEGVRFTQAYAGSTVCAPSRCCLMTGLHNGHTRVRDNIPHGITLQPDDFTIAEMLKQAGYAGGGFGKWSLGTPGSWGVPLYQGFDEYFGQLNQDQAHQYYPDYLWDDDRVMLLMENRADRHAQYAPDLFAEHALDYIDRHRRHPFFLYFATTLPHWSDFPEGPDSQIVPSDEPYSAEPWPQVEKNYAAMVTRLDTQVGRILDRLREHGLLQNTAVIFTSDNGPSAEREHSPAFFRSAGPLRGVKRDVYEGGIRVPLIVRWPERIRPGSLSRHLCAFWDFMPTIADLIGLPAPAKTDGISFLAELSGKPQPEHEYLYWDYGHVRKEFKQAARYGNWKGVRNGVHSPIEIYDLGGDIGESRNLASNRLDVVRRMESIFKEALIPSKDYPIPGLTAP